jgi:asparagine synthase (glutamine-hydrolysing)
MCGISGFINTNPASGNTAEIVQRMNARLAHRGPDNQDVWMAGEICLGHTRLSIIDLSPQSNQPFKSDDGRYVIVYNGELYNYRSLMLELQRASVGNGQEPYFFHTSSDTEVVLAAFIRWGIECLQRFNGMYAFALYDNQEKKLWVARDRMGVKPLYYNFSDDGFMFSSEIRAIIHSGIKKFFLDKERVGEYLMYQTVHAPGTIVKGVSMLMPGHYLLFENGKATTTRYYDLNNIRHVDEGLSYEQVCKRTYELLGAAVERRLIADVPFGAFLSGGIDSSAVVGLMTTLSAEPVSTFNVNFDESNFSEARYARLISKKFNTRHHEINLTPGDFLKQLPEALDALDHPSGDGPNTYVVSKATKKAGITMALSGIGGDELFAGYDVFRRTAKLQRQAWVNFFPAWIRKAGSGAMRLKSSVSAHKAADLLAEDKIDFVSAYKYSRTVFSRSVYDKLNVGNDPFKFIEPIIKSVPQDEGYLLSAVSLAEMSTYLQNVLLRDTDQMSMAVALEVREPFLDHQLVEFVLGVPDKFKFPLTPKKLLTDSLGDLLPSEIVNRPKMGFTLPWKDWMKNDMRGFCESHIKGFAARGICDGEKINELWQRFIGGDPLVTWSRVWHIIVLNHWIEKNQLLSN